MTCRRTRSRLKCALVIASTLLSFGVMCLWSYTSTIDDLLLSVWADAGLSVRVAQGRMDWRRVDARGEPLPKNPTAAIPRTGIPMPRPVFGFAFSRGNAFWYFAYPNDLRRTAYWQLSVPLWFVLGIASVPWLVWLYRWRRSTGRQRIGFDVTTRSSPAPQSRTP